MSENRRTLSDIREEIDTRLRYLRGAIRWLSEARRFKTDFGGDTWKPGEEGSLAGVADKMFTEAISDVICARESLERAREEYRRATVK